MGKVFDLAQSQLDRGVAPIGQKPRSELRPMAVAGAIEAHPGGLCPRSRGSWLVGNDGSGKPAGVVPVRCQSWRCPHCSKLLSLSAYCCLADGLARSDRTRLITLTDGSNGALDVAGLYCAWQKLTLRLKRRGLLGDFAYTLELSPRRNLLHMHCLMAESKRGGGYIDAKELSNQAAASGFGKIVDIRQVADGSPVLPSLSAYLAPEAWKSEELKNLAHYCTKSSAEALALKSAARVRPFRTSRNWPGGSLRSCEAQLMDEWYGNKTKPSNISWEFWGEWDLSQEIKIHRQVRAPFRSVSSSAA